MTAGSLTGLIALALFAQVLLWATVAFARHWRDYILLRERAKDGGVPAVRPAPLAERVEAGWDGWRPLRVDRKVYEDEAHSICSFYLAPVDGFPLPAFEPGQYLTLQLDVEDPARHGLRQVTRCYSLSDRPRPDRYRITVKRVPAPADRPELPAGLGSSHLHDRIDEGDVLLAKAPRGPFHLTDRGDAPLALVGGGIGITPMLSIAETLLHEGSRRELWLFYGVRNRSDHAMKARLEQLAAEHPNLHLHVCYSRPDPDDVAGVDYRHQGRVDIDRLRLTLPRRVETFYVCGPPALMESLVPALDAWGVPEAQIHYEAFGPATVSRRPVPPTRRPAAPITVTFSKSGRQLVWEPDAGTLLEFAEAHGVEVESGCRAGSCGGCQTRVEAGEVDYLQAPDAEPAPGACLLCVSTPKSDLTLSA